MLYVGIKYIQDDNAFSQAGGRPAVIILCSSSVLILGGVIGCVGAVWEKKTCLGLFLVFLASVLIVQVAVSCLMFTNKNNMKTTFDDFVTDQFELYGSFGNDTVVVNNKTVNPVEGINATEFVDKLQEKSKCCGMQNYTDWASLPGGRNGTVVPLSCCKPQTSGNKTCTGSIAESELDLIYQKFLGCCIVVGLLCYRRNQPIGYSHISPGYTEA
uniref:Uncharacterized protein n=1 Tax=Ciona savignyi TaxID=51511 RepID=H2Z9K3_CIOSA